MILEFILIIIMCTLLGSILALEVLQHYNNKPHIIKNKVLFKSSTDMSEILRIYDETKGEIPKLKYFKDTYITEESKSKLEDSFCYKVNI